MLIRAEVLAERIMAAYGKPMPHGLALALYKGQGVVQHGMDIYVVTRPPLRASGHHMPTILAGQLAKNPDKRVADYSALKYYLRALAANMLDGPLHIPAGCGQFLPVVKGFSIVEGCLGRNHIVGRQKLEGRRIVWYSTAQCRIGDIIYVREGDSIRAFVLMTTPSSDRNERWLRLRLPLANVADMRTILHELAAEYGGSLTSFEPMSGELPPLNLTVHARDVDNG